MSKVRNLASRRPGGSRDLSGRTERPVTVRVDDDRLGLMTGLAIVDETTVAEQIRLASELYIAVRLEDPMLETQADRAVARFQSNFTTLRTAHRQRLGIDDVETQEHDQATIEAPAKPDRNADTEKPVTFRLDTSTVDYFTGLALLDDWTLADELRAAIDAYVIERRKDPELVQQITDAGAEQAELLARLQPAG